MELILCLCLALQGPIPPAAQLLEQAVDRATAEERRAAALELSVRAEVTLDDWLAAAGAFGRFEAVEPGVQRREPDGLGELWLFVPTGYDPARPTPLLVALHGSGGEGRGALEPWRETAERLGLLVLAPTDHGASEGYSYQESERAAVLAALRWTRRHFNVDESRVHLTGVSRGGHLAWDLALRHPDLFASLAPIVGGPRIENAEGRNNLRYLENLTGTSILDLQGALDDPLLVANVRLAFRRLAHWKAADARLIEFAELGHGLDATTVAGAADWGAFFARAERDPRPTRVVRRSARAGEGRAFWIEVLETEPEFPEDFQPRISAAAWQRLSPTARQEAFQDGLDGHTSRLEALRKDAGVFHVTRKGVARFRMLLTRTDLPQKRPLRVRLESRERSLAVHEDAGVLLCEFVERFDRGFLPVVRVELP